MVKFVRRILTVTFMLLEEVNTALRHVFCKKVLPIFHPFTVPFFFCISLKAVYDLTSWRRAESLGRSQGLNARALCFLFEEDFTFIPAAAILLLAFKLNCTFALLSSKSLNVGCESRDCSLVIFPCSSLIILSVFFPEL